MKSIKQSVDPITWSQLIDKINDADRGKKHDNSELQKQIDTILGDKDLKVTIPKSSKAFDTFKAKTH